MRRFVGVRLSGEGRRTARTVVEGATRDVTDEGDRLPTLLKTSNSPNFLLLLPVVRDELAQTPQSHHRVPLLAQHDRAGRFGAGLSQRVSVCASDALTSDSRARASAFAIEGDWPIEEHS